MRVNRLNGLPFGQLRYEMDRLFGDFFGPGTTAAATVFPALNVWEQGDDFFAEAELPGLKNDDVEIEVVGNELTIRGRRPDFQQNEGTYFRRERGAGEFVRSLRLPVEINAEQVQASLQDGVLLITLPKAESAKPRRITVNAAS